ncbi:MAG TPA: hypothetical protein VFK54_01850 [Candidatus Limnocylindrales bacterium]|nr:hypothetical protein [Candidatus Limnocylindrales bacterium]
MQSRSTLLTAAVLTAAVLGACTGAGASNPSSSPMASPSMTDHPKSMAPSMAPSSTAPMTDSAAADLRAQLDLVLGEHIILAAKATGAALGGRNDEFAAYGALLNTNGTDLGAMIGAAYGDAAKDQWNQIWSAHNGFFVDYTTGVATDDTARMDKAVQDLTTIYVPDFAEFLAGATGLPQDAVASLLTDHVLQTKAIVDAQAAGDWDAAYAAIREAYAHMQMIGDALAPAVATAFPDTFPGDPSTKAVDLRVGLNQLLQEHLYLASFATGAALGGRNDEFAAAGGALNTNGTDLGAAIGGLYGDAAKDQWNRIWSAHNGFFVDYTTGVATDDQAKIDKAVSDLTTVYVPQFAEFLAGATDIPQDALESLITEHVLTTKAIVDAQGAGDVEAAAAADREAAQHMAMLADPLAAAIVAKLGDTFR